MLVYKSASALRLALLFVAVVSCYVTQFRFQLRNIQCSHHPYTQLRALIYFTPQHHHHDYSSATMASNRAPACLSMQNLINCINTMPGADHGASLSTTTAVLNLLHSPHHLHLFSLRASVDEILHVGALIHAHYSQSSTSPRPLPAIIVVDDIADGFSKICALATQVSGERPSNITSSIRAFSRMTIVRGSKPPSACASRTAYNTALNAAMSSITMTLTHFSKVHPNARVIWHSHADPTLLLQILSTTREPPLDAITIFDALLFPANSITLAHPNPNRGISNPWPQLFTATSRLRNGRGVPLVFASSSAMRSELHRYSIHYLIGLRDRFPAILPESVWKPAVGRVMDQLLVGVFRLYAGGDLGAHSPKRTGSAVVREIKRRLDCAVARGWAAACVEPLSYHESAIKATVKGALPARFAPLPPYGQPYWDFYLTGDTRRTKPNDPLPTFAALTQMIAYPLPAASASALSRLALGRHAAPLTSAPSSSRPARGPGNLWAVRTTICPRPAPLPPNTPAESVALQIVASGSNAHVLTTPQPEAVQNATGAQWAQYVSGMQNRERTFAARSGGGSGGFGVSVETARAWCHVVPGLVATVVEEWSRTVAPRLDRRERERLEREVRGLVRAAREGSFTQRCQRVLRG